MQAEDRRRKLHSPSGAENSHSVCHSCGWTFPNPHPSAKHRRAHRRHCGKIDGFPLVSPHAGEDGGGNVNDGHDDVVTPAVDVAVPAEIGVQLPDALPRSPMESVSSLAALETPAMEGGNVDTRCGTGERMRTFGSIGCHEDKALVEVHSANPEDPSEATAAPGDDKEFKVPDLLHGKEIEKVDVMKVMAQLENVLSASEAVDSLQDMETKALQDVNTPKPGGLDASSFMNRAVSEEQCTEIANLSEAPSLSLTGGSNVSIEATANDTSPHNQATYESKERKKKEEIIAKVEGWSSCKQHTPLKTLLVEANIESRQKTPIHKLPMNTDRSQAQQKEGFRTGTPVPVSEHLTDTSVKKAVQKEWNSPARLPTSKIDKRKSKGKPQWVPFLCCPSLN